MLEGEFRLNPARIDTAELVDRLRSMISLKAEIKGLKCDILAETGLPPSFEGDMRRILQVMLNLSYNAIKYTFKGGIKISIWYDKPGDQLWLEVKDSGIGIQPEDLIRLNKLFGLLDRKAALNETGIGLGFIVSRSIVMAMDGDLQVTSEVGRGTTCTVKLPLGPSKRVSATVYHVRIANRG